MRSDVAHNVAEGADGIEKHREGISQARLEALTEALIRGHTPEKHHQQETGDDHRGHHREIGLLADDQVQNHEIQGIDGRQPAQVCQPAQVLFRQLAADIHDAG